MRTTIELDDKLLAKAIKKSGAKTEREAVHIALKAFVNEAPDYSAILALGGKGLITPGYDPKALYRVTGDDRI